MTFLHNGNIIGDSGLIHSDNHKSRIMDNLSRAQQKRWKDHQRVYDTPEYRSYSGAKQRCTNSKSKNYADYGGRGIEFRFVSFQQFINCVGNKPTPKHSLDRIENEGHYEPGNVRWATCSEQNRNQRKRFVLDKISDEELLDEILRRGIHVWRADTFQPRRRELGPEL